MTELTRFGVLVAAPFLAALFLMVSDAAQAEQTPPPDARVYFVNLNDGDTVASPVNIQFGAEGVKVMKSGLNLPKTGHHHLLIDTDIEEADKGFALPETDNIIHFGSGQTEIDLYLPPGQHTLRLVFGDGDHVPYYPFLMSEKITITVTE